MTARTVATSVLWHLSGPHGEADRRRNRLVIRAIAGSGVLLLAVLALLTIPGPALVTRLADGTPAYLIPPETRGLADYVAQADSRRGTALAAFLLAIPFAVFGVQAMRTGTAARERRLAALSLAGASRRQLRRLAFLEGTRAAVIGGLLAGPGYLVLWLVLGQLLPEGARMLPRPSLALLLGWPLLVVLLGLAGGWAAALAARPGSVSPLGITRRQVRALGRGRALTAGIGLCLIVIALPLMTIHDVGALALPVLMALIVLVAVSGSPWLILLVGRRAQNGNLITVLAGRRLLADVRSPGRAASVLFAVGLVLGVIAAVFRDVVEDSSPAYGLWGLTAVILAGLIAAVLASLSLLVGVTEQILDGRRATATLVALAASPDWVYRVVRRQLLLVAVPAAVIGAVIGWVATIAMGSGNAIFPPLDWFLLSLPICLALAGGAAAVGATVTAGAARPAIRESSTPDNLRTA